METNKQKGDLLEHVTEQLCSGIKDATTTRDAKIRGRSSKKKRQIDVLIEGKMGPFPVRIIVEAKNYKGPVGVSIVEELVTKLTDVGGNLGAIVSHRGFTKPAKDMAEAKDIRLFEVFDPSLGNSPWLLPLRSFRRGIKRGSIRLGFSSNGSHFSIPLDQSRLRFHVDGKTITHRDIPYYAWNKKMFPHEKGEQIAHFDSIKMSNLDKPGFDQFCTFEVFLEVEERYFLKLFPVSFIRVPDTNKEHYTVKIDDYTNEDDLLKNGWIEYPTRENMEAAANIENQPGPREFFICPEFHYPIGDEDGSAEAFA